MKYMQYFLFQRMGRLFIACFIPCSIWLGFPKASAETQLALLVFGRNTAAEQPLDGKSDHHYTLLHVEKEEPDKFLLRLQKTQLSHTSVLRLSSISFSIKHFTCMTFVQ